jgi:hypothetical protein
VVKKEDGKQKTLTGWRADVFDSLAPLNRLPVAAKAAGCSVNTMRRRVARGDVEHVRNGNAILIPRLAIIAMLGGSA